jgi:DNA polymerase IV (DinB-like DNA polymerase)
MDRVIFHVDLDAFYASCEIRRNPDLKGLSVIIGADPKEGKGRGVVMTASYEARKFGVRSGMPISRAYKLCPQGIYIHPDMKYYKEMSDAIMKILRPYADDDDEELMEENNEGLQEIPKKFEQWGFDEAFLDVTQKVKEVSDPTVLAMKIKNEIFNKLRLTCSVGIGPNKQVAKIASDFKKPDGITLVSPEEVQAFLDPLSVDKIIGIGPKTKKILNNKLNIRTIAELADFPARELNKIFGKMGIYIHNIARGIDNSPVRSGYERKSLGSEITFDQDVEDFTSIYKALEMIIERLHKSLIKHNWFYQTCVIKIRFQNFNTYTRQKKLKIPTNNRKLALKVGKQLLKEFEGDNRKVRLLGFRFTSLSKAKHVQKTLFD